MNLKISFLLVLCCVLLTSCFRTRAEIAQEKAEKERQAALQQEVIEYNQNMERMQAEMGRLQGKLEELEHQRKKEQSTFSSSQEGTEKNVGELKARLEEQQKTQATLFEEMKRLKEENLQLLKNMEKARSSAPAGASATGGSGAQKKNAASSFESALTAYKAKDYEASASAFRGYLQSYPKGKRAADARYFLADSLYRQKAYTDAIVEFGALHEQAPASALGRKSALRIAESFKALGKDKDAKAFAQLLVQSSPNSAEAKQARKFLR